MNTLPRATTARFFATPAEYQALKNHWSTLLNSDEKHNLTAAHHTLYLALMGKDWRKGFTLTKSIKRLQNGAFEGWALFSTLAHIHSPHGYDLLPLFNGLVTLQQLLLLRAYLPKPSPYNSHPNQFANHLWPFDAYVNVLEQAEDHE